MMFTSLSFRLSAIIAATLLMTALAGCPADDKKADAAKSTTATTATAAADAPAGPCEHGVQKDICTRCNPALAVAFKAKSDWCDEHNRAESQCVLCHPDLAQKGIK
jgi:hypothetical protein